MFWKHSNQHSSKTDVSKAYGLPTFWKHSNQHSSKTIEVVEILLHKFWKHSNQHSSKTSQKKFFRQCFIITLLVHSKTSALNASLFYHYTMFSKFKK
ncbi:conserved hypothetical protein [Enterococcus faecium Com12]|nr:conserved hypothetical protein [Enterococcus faecium Com12]